MSQPDPREAAGVASAGRSRVRCFREDRTMTETDSAITIEGNLFRLVMPSDWSMSLTLEGVTLLGLSGEEVTISSTPEAPHVRSKALANTSALERADSLHPDGRKVAELTACGPAPTVSLRVIYPNEIPDGLPSITECLERIEWYPFRPEKTPNRLKRWIEQIRVWWFSVRLG
jgi:hypothetical protein